MTEISTNIKPASDNRLNQWLFNPFRFVAGYKALLLGLAIILAGALVGSLSNTHFDGVLDIHTGMKTPLWYFIAEGLINWLCMVVPLFFFALFVSRSSFRAIDIIGTQALARWPHLITTLVMLPDANRRFGDYLMTKLNQGGPPAAVNPADAFIFVIAIIVTLLMIIWMVALMYRAYYVSCNIKGARAIGTFIVTLVGAEILSKFVIFLLPV